MRLNILLAAAAVAALTAGAAVAQSTPMSSGSDTSAAPANPSATDSSTMSAPSATQNGAPAAATMGAAVASSPTPADQAYTLKAGDPNVVSNPPIPDTPANRHLYGKPMSNAGRHTAAIGD
jgi:hypothetical protein